MSTEQFKKLALSEAEQSLCKKRKVGAVLTDGTRVASGRNYHPLGLPCEDVEGCTSPEVVHAECSALATWRERYGEAAMPQTAYVTHPPCAACRATLLNAGVTSIVVVEEFLKFDSKKPRFDLVPPSAILALAEVLTYGAKKYKPENWRNVPDTSRYVAALMRHFEAFRSGEEVDPESGLPHLAHAMTNLAFLLELTDKKDKK